MAPNQSWCRSGNSLWEQTEPSYGILYKSDVLYQLSALIEEES
jgi:hypothetical protein